MKAIFPETIDGDLLKLVHMSNGFHMVKGERPLHVGDVCHSEAQVVAVINNDSGKIVKVKGNVIRNGKPVIEVVSSFLYRGRFADFDRTFEVVEEPDYIVETKSEADVGVLQSKEWFQWDDDSKPLKSGVSLIFRLKSEVSYKDKTHYSSVAVLGDVFIRDPLKNLVKVGTVDFESDNCQGNPVVAYLQRHGTAQNATAALSNEGYSLISENVSMNFSTPLTNEPYSMVSGDFNPIHINPYFSDFASLPGTITHGMWSSAATRRYVENVAAKGRPDRVLSYVHILIDIISSMS